jgi:hypothetical protein
LTIATSVSAAGLAGYAALVAVAVALEGRTVPHGFAGPDAAIRAALALGLAGAVLMRPQRAWRYVVWYTVWLGAFGAVAVGGQLFQRYVADGSGNYILINPTMFALSIAMEMALAVALVGVLLRRVNPPSGSLEGKGPAEAPRAP